MLKKNLKIISILMLIVLVLSTSIVMATEDTASNEQNSQEAATETEAEAQAEAKESESTNQPETNTESSAKKEIKNSDVYLTGDEITIDYMIDGNLFVIANSVIIDSQIGGDAFICAKNIKVTTNGFVYGNVFSISQDLNIEGTIYDLFAVAQNTTISGYVYRDIKVASGNINIFGTIRRNAFLDTKNLSFKTNVEMDENDENGTQVPSQGVINGNLTYSAPSEVSVSKENVLGEVEYQQQATVTSNNIQTYLISLGTLLTTVIIIWLLGLWLTPKFINNTQKLLTKKALPVIGFGFLGLICLPIISFILLVIGIASKIALILFTLYFILLAVASSIFIISITNIVCKKIKSEKSVAKLGILILCGIAFWIIKLIPVVGGIISFIATVLGLGIIIYSIIKKGNFEESVATQEQK